MVDRDHKDVTASELLRKAAIRETDEWGNITPQVKLFSALLGEDAALTDYVERGDLLRKLADKIDAELFEAKSEASNTSFEAYAKMWAKINGWPDFRDGEDFGAWLDRCAIPRPRFGDGEPVQWEDDPLWDDPQLFIFNAVSKNGVPLAVGRGRICARAEMTDDGFVKRPASSPEELGADGLPIVAGETVWGILSATKGIVNSLNDDSTAYVEWDDGRWSPCIDCCNLTHTPPDTQQKIDEDAEKFHCVYFGGYSACGTCPASTGELSKKSCKQQQIFDLLRRQRELDARKGGAE